MLQNQGSLREGQPFGSSKQIFHKGDFAGGPVRPAPHRGLPHPDLTMAEILRASPPSSPQNPKAHPEVPHPPPDGAKPRLCPPGGGPPVPGTEPAREGEAARRGEGTRRGSFGLFPAIPRFPLLFARCRTQKNGTLGDAGSARQPGDAGARLPEGCTGVGAQGQPAPLATATHRPPQKPPLGKGT